VIERTGIDSFFSSGTVLRERDMDLLGNERVAESGKNESSNKNNSIHAYIYERPYN
jgi:hypothetical protein